MFLQLSGGKIEKKKKKKKKKRKKYSFIYVNSSV